VSGAVVSEDPILTLRLLVDEVVTATRAVTAGKSLSELSTADLESAISGRTQERIFEVVITESGTLAECARRFGIVMGNGARCRHRHTQASKSPRRTGQRVSARALGARIRHKSPQTAQNRSGRLDPRSGPPFPTDLPEQEAPWAPGRLGGEYAFAEHLIALEVPRRLSRRHRERPREGPKSPPSSSTS